MNDTRGGDQFVGGIAFEVEAGGSPGDSEVQRPYVQAGEDLLDLLIIEVEVESKKRPPLARSGATKLAARSRMSGRWYSRQTSPSLRRWSKIEWPSSPDNASGTSAFGQVILIGAVLHCD